MVDFNVGNLLKLPQLLKIPEFFMNFIILIIARAGFKGDPVAPFHIDGAIISILVSYGLFLVVLIQLIAILLGDKTPISDVLISFLASILLISAGSVVIKDAGLLPDIPDVNEGIPPMRGLGALQIINALLYLIDFVFSVMNVVKGEKS